jgi:hypothetical protein
MKAWWTGVRRAMRKLAQARKPNAAACGAAQRASVPAPRTPARSWFRALAWCGLFALVLVATPAHAALDGPTIWANIKTLIFGPWGLIIGFIICVIGLCGIPKWGLGWCFGICGAAVAFFMVPGILTVFQTSASGLSG